MGPAPLNISEYIPIPIQQLLLNCCLRAEYARCKHEMRFGRAAFGPLLKRARRRYVRSQKRFWPRAIDYTRFFD